MPAPISTRIAWICLLVAGLLEIVWSLSMKASDGFSRGWMTALTAVTMGLSVWLLSAAVRALPLGTAYAVWTGIGAAGAAVFGILIFKEPVHPTLLLVLDPHQQQPTATYSACEFRRQQLFWLLMATRINALRVGTRLRSRSRPSYG